MNESENKIEVIKQIYQHALSHITEDNRANKVIIILNLHWCVEDLIRLATKGWASINYKDTFITILDKFNRKYSIDPKLKVEIIRLNDYRNGIYHKSIYPDFSEIKTILPFAKKFIEWMGDKVFNFKFDLDSKLEPDLLLSFKRKEIINSIALNQLKKSRNYKNYYTVLLYLHNIGFFPYTSIDIKLNSYKHKEIKYDYRERTESHIQPKPSKRENRYTKNYNDLLIGIREKNVKRDLNKKFIRIYREKKMVIFKNIEKVKHNDIKQLDPFMIYIPKFILNDNIVLNYKINFDQPGGYEPQILHIIN